MLRVHAGRHSETSVDLLDLHLALKVLADGLGGTFTSIYYRINIVLNLKH